MKEAWQRYYFKGELPEDIGPAPEGPRQQAPPEGALKFGALTTALGPLANGRALCHKPPLEFRGRASAASRSAGVAQW